VVDPVYAALDLGFMFDLTLPRRTAKPWMREFLKFTLHRGVFKVLQDKMKPQLR